MRRNAMHVLFSGLLLLSLSGCGSQPLFQIETAVQGDGSCTRTIWQPTAEMLPEEASRQEWIARWGRTGTALVPPAFAAERPRESGRQYLVASGTFPSPAEIPDHFRSVMQVGPARGVGRLERRYERRDYAFVVEHRWRETLTNIVSRDGFLAASSQFLDFGMPLLEEGVNRVYGGQYDVKGLLHDLRTDGRGFLERVALLWFEESSAHREDAFADRLAETAGEFGLDLKAAGKRVEGTDLDDRLKAFLKHRILLGFRHLDGQRLTEPEVQAILESGPDSPYSRAWETFWKEHQKELESRLSGPVLAMFGLYNNPLGIHSTGNPKFAVTLRLPGEIVETSGTRAAGGTTAWRFSGDTSFPGGYAMSARSLDIDRKAQERVLGRAAIADLKQAQAFVRLAESSAMIRDRLDKVRSTGERRWLDPAASDDAASRDRLQELRQLLGLSR